MALEQSWKKLWVLVCLVLVAALSQANSDWNSTVTYTCGVRLRQDEPVEFGVMYARLIRLQHNGSANGRLIATYEHFPNNFIIYQSDDDGLTWAPISTVVESHLPAPWVFEGEPHLYELQQAVGNLPAGTILLAGSAVRTNPDGVHLMQNLEVYYSTDQGVTWNYQGTADTNDGLNGGIWEPNLQVAANGQLVMYYSDERFMPTYNQVLAERVSADGGQTWSAEKFIVAVPDGMQRPGMAVTQRISAGAYVMSCEWVNNSGPNPAYVRFSADGINWGDPTSRGIPVQAANGSYLGATPYCMWVPFGGNKGTLIVSGRTLTGSPNTDRELFINTNMGQGPWTAIPSPVQWQGGSQFCGWSMGMIPTADGRGVIQMATSFAGNNSCECLIGREPILLPGQNYTLANQNSAKLLGIPANSFTHGTFLQQLTSDGSIGQTWTLQDLGNTNFLITNPFTGLTLDDFNWLTPNGSGVDEWDQNGLTVQQWKPIPTGAGSFKFLNVNSGRVLAVNGASTDSGASLVIWDDNGTPDHVWQPGISALASTTGVSDYPPVIVAGQSSRGLVSIPTMAGTGGTYVNLSSSSNRTTVPPKVFIPPGAHEATFQITTMGIDVDTPVTITATNGGVTWSTVLTVKAATLSLVVTSPSTTLGGKSLNFYAYLNGPAGPSGVNATLTSSNSSIVPLPPSVSFADGASSARTVVLASPVDSTQTVTLGATEGAVSKSANLTVLPADIYSIAPIGASVVGGNIGKLVVALSAPAGSSGTAVNLSSNRPDLAAIPSSISIPSGLLSTTISFNTAGVDTATPITFSASVSGAVTRTGSMTIQPATVNQFTAFITSIKGGQSKIFYVYLNGLPGPSGVTVNLSSDNPAVLSIPASIMIPAGTQRGSAMVTTTAVTTTTTVHLSATANGSSFPSSIDVTP